ncbi:MAG: hypothetical protein JJ979_02565 [Roseibium sp.]|nr:hypothetical protein [Roseibium sp.]
MTNQVPEFYVAVDGAGKHFAYAWHEDKLRRYARQMLKQTSWWQDSILRKIPLIGWLKTFALDWQVEREVDQHMETIRWHKKRAEADGGHLLLLTAQEYDQLIGQEGES